MDRLLRLWLFVSAVSVCAALPAPDATTSGPTLTGTPVYIDTIQSIQCIGSDKIRMSFQNQYSFMDAWEWGLPRAILLNADTQTVDCDDYKPIGAAWLTSNTADNGLYSQCASGGECIVEFMAVPADGTFKDMLINYLQAQNMQIASTSIADPEVPTVTGDVTSQNAAPQYTVDPWQARQYAQWLDDLTNNPGAGAGAGAGDALPTAGGGGYQRWQEIANDYEKQVNDPGDPEDAAKDLTTQTEEELQQQAENTANDLVKSAVKADAEVFAAFFGATVFAASIRALLIRATESAVGKTLVQQFVKTAIQRFAAPLLGELIGAGAATGGEIAGAGVSAAIPVVGEVIGAVIIIFSEYEAIKDMLETPEMNQDYQIGEFKLTGPNGKEYWVIEQGSTGAPPAYVAPDVPKQFKDPFFFVPPQLIFDPTNIDDNGGLKYDPWPKIGWKSYEPLVAGGGTTSIGKLPNGPEDGEPAPIVSKPPVSTSVITNTPPAAGQPKGQEPEVSDQPAQPQISDQPGQPEPQITDQPQEPQPAQSQAPDNGQSTTTTTNQPPSSAPPSQVSRPASSTQPKCMVPTKVSNFINDFSKAFPDYNLWSKTFTINKGLTGETTFKCSLACKNCSLTFNHETVFQNMLGKGQVDGDVDLHINMELTCNAGDNWKDAFKTKASQPILFGFPAYKKYKKVWQGAGPYCSDFALGAALGVSFVPFKGKLSFGFDAHKTVSMPIAAQGDTSRQDMSQFHSDWTFTWDPAKFSGFGLPSLSLGMDLTADWGWGLSDTPPLLDAGFDLYPNATMSFLSRDIKIKGWGEVSDCEYPFAATAGEKPFIYVSALGKDIWDTVLTPFQQTFQYTKTAFCPTSSGPTFLSGPGSTVTTTTTSTPLMLSPIPYSLRLNSTLAIVTTSSASSATSNSADEITAWPWPDPTFVMQTDMFSDLETTTDIQGTEYQPSYLSSLLRPQSTSIPTTTTSTNTPKITNPAKLSSAPVSISLPASSSVTQPASTTISSLSALPTVTGVWNTDASCGYGQGACADGYHCLKVWPVEVAQSYMCGQPDLTNFEPLNIPADYSPPTNNGIWACDANSICYPTCGYFGALFDPTTWTCANPIDNAMWSCLDDAGNTVISPAAANSATKCQMVCQPGFGMTSTGECVDILMDSTNCGQIGFDCSFGYTGYYAATPACAMGMCVNLCPAGYMPFVNLCMNFQTDAYNCGSFGNQCNVANQEVCKNGGCVQCYECYGSI